MAKLYVVNCTGQHRVVNYRVDYTVDDQGRRISERLVPYKSQSFPPRQQQQFGSDWFPGQLESIITQLEQSAGAVHINEIRTAKAKGVVKLLYQLDKPVSEVILRDVVDHNMGLLSEQGSRRRAQLALVADASLKTALQGALEPQKLDVEFEQADDDADFEGHLEEGLRIDRTAQAKTKTAPRGGRRKAASAG